MSSLEDLVRETFATRAHDVDGVELTAPPRAAHHGRRWVAVGTVIAVAAALVIAVVLAAPWRATPQRTSTPATVAEPPAGMQWISYHGITLTVPDSWAVGAFPCTAPATNAVEIPGPIIYCPMLPNSTTPPGVMIVRLGELGGDESQGDATTVAGHAASRFISDGSPISAAYVQYQLPEAGVVIRISPYDDRQVAPLLDSIEYTPVDHYGCAAQQPAPATVPGATLDVPGNITSGVVCEYESGTVDSRGLLGSRQLDQAEIARIRELVQQAAPAALPQPLRIGPGYGLHQYRFRLAGGGTWILTADLSTGQIVVSDEAHSAVATGAEVSVLPGAYPN